MLAAAETALLLEAPLLLAGEPGCFIAMEKGHVLGTPFPQGHAYEQWQAIAITWAVDGAVFLKPVEDVNGTH